MCRARDKLAKQIFEENGYTRKKGIHYRTFEKRHKRHFDLDWNIDYLISVRLSAFVGLPGYEG